MTNTPHPFHRSR